MNEASSSVIPAGTRKVDVPHVLGGNAHVLGEAARIEVRRLEGPAHRDAAAPAVVAGASTGRGAPPPPARPGGSPPAPAPASTTSPTTSWPRTAGRGAGPRSLARSEPHRPQPRTRSRSSPGPIAGAGRVSRRISPAPAWTAALMGRAGRAGRRRARWRSSSEWKRGCGRRRRGTRAPRSRRRSAR